MASKPPRKENVVVKEIVLGDKEEVVVKNLKCEGVHPVLPKVGSKVQAELHANLRRMGCVGLMDQPWILKRMQLPKEIRED